MPRMTTRIVGPTAAGPSRILPTHLAALAAAAALVVGCAAHAATPREQAAAAFAELRREIPLRVAEPARPLDDGAVRGARGARGVASPHPTHQPASPSNPHGAVDARDIVALVPQQRTLWPVGRRFGTALTYF